jgi:hypothetical protein
VKQILRIRSGVLVWIMASGFAFAGEVVLPPRPPDAPKGAEFARRIAGLDLATREKEIIAEIARGNVPEFWRHFVAVTVTRQVEGQDFTAVYEVAPDYLAIGSDDDYLLIPVSPETAQVLADSLDCVLPTPRMVADIYAAAAVKLAPMPIPPSAEMTTVPVFVQHNEIVGQQRASNLVSHPLGALVAGDKKDLVLTRRLADAPGKVAIYGWQRLDGTPIQPLYVGHAASWVDYSQGTRLVRQNMTVDGKSTTVAEVLADAKKCVLLSDEGPLLEPRYGKVHPPASNQVSNLTASGWTGLGARFHETNETMHFKPGVDVVLNLPETNDLKKPVRLVLYALPNGNTIEQTIGRKITTNGDWHFDIQHIGAQTRWLRAQSSDVTLVVAYLQCAGNAWPAWLNANDPQGRRVGQIVAALRDRFASQSPSLVLTGHSGGGSFTFAYLDSVERIPDDIERIAFLDSDYRYDAAKDHARKLVEWLSSTRPHYLCVLAYHDSIALLNGKTFVSEQGGTWGRSHALQADLAEKFYFTREEAAPWERFTALDGRIKFVLNENPDKAILHTKQVELNGFIHAMVTGTALENRGYTYFGPRAYEASIAGP